MGVLYIGANGVLLRALRPYQEALFPDPPAGTVRTVRFDSDTNEAIHERCGLGPWDALRVLADGSLSYPGGVVPLAPDGPTLASAENTTTLRTRVAGALAGLRTIRTQAGTLKGQSTAWTIKQQQSVAAALETLADDLIAVGRLAADLKDDTN